MMIHGRAPLFKPADDETGWRVTRGCLLVLVLKYCHATIHCWHVARQFSNAIIMDMPVA
jgi:hypothetical protein